jgi:hypothetical protein
MNGPDGKPTKPDDDFEPLEPALEPWFGKKFAELPAELQERITRDRRAPWLAIDWDRDTPGQRRTSAQQRDWNADPTNKDELDFWWDVDCRYDELKRREDELMVVPAIGAQAVAARNHEQRLIKAERIALKEDESEVRSAAPTELRAMIEQVRRRWNKRDSIAAGLIAAVIPENVAEKSGADTQKGKTSTGGAPERVETKRPIAPTAEQSGSSNGEATAPLAIRNKPGGGGIKMTAAVEAMVRAVKEERTTYADLQQMRQKALPDLYPNAKRTLLVQAREAALRRLVEEGYPMSSGQLSRARDTSDVAAT